MKKQKQKQNQNKINKNKNKTKTKKSIKKAQKLLKDIDESNDSKFSKAERKNLQIIFECLSVLNYKVLPNIHSNNPNP